MKNCKMIRFILSCVVPLLITADLSFSQVCQTDKRNRPRKTTVTDAAILDINNVACYFQNNGGFGENPETHRDGCYYPAGQTELSLIYTAGLWVVSEVNGQIRSAVNNYGSEFQPGQILSSGVADNPGDPKYKVYKFLKGETVDTEAIEQGCPETVLGDQMLFCVYNDLKSHEQMWKSEPIGLEVQQTAFAFDRPGALGNTLFIRYRIINKGTDFLNDAYVAVGSDADLGFASDDYHACDPHLNMSYTYNGDGYDEKYGVQVPAFGFDFLQGPIVPSPGENAILPDGTFYPNSKILGMTANFGYI